MALTPEETLAHLREVTNLAEQGKYRCQYCKQIKSLQDGIVITWGGHVLFAMCPACFPGRPIVIRESVLSSGKLGVKVGFLNEADKPLVQVARGDVANKFVAGGALAARVKKEFPSE